MRFILMLILTCGVAVAQNTNSPAPTNARATTNDQHQSRQTRTDRHRKTCCISAEETAAPAGQQAPGSEGVLAAFNNLLDGIRHADVKEVMEVYWNNPQLNLFNYNGTVTKSWEQVRKNRESSYPEIKDVKLEVRDVSVTMLGTTGAIVTCQWTQSQTYKGAPETVSGRMTLVVQAHRQRVESDSLALVA